MRSAVIHEYRKQKKGDLTSLVVKTASQVALVGVEASAEVPLTTAGTAVLKVLSLAATTHGTSGLVFDLQHNEGVTLTAAACVLLQPDHEHSQRILTSSMGPDMLLMYANQSNSEAEAVINSALVQ